MAFGRFNNSAPPIAIEFGVHSLKALQIEPGNPPRLLAAGCIETPEALLTDDVGRLTFQAQNLPDLLRTGNFKGKRAICSLPGRQTIVHHLQVQRTEGQPLAPAVASQLQFSTGIDPNQAVVRHFEVGEFNRGGVSKTEVICIAVSRDVVFKQISAVRAAKLEPVGLHTNQVAIIRAFDNITRRVEDDQLTTMYIDIGAGTTKLVIAHGREMRFAKTIDVAGRTLDELVAKQLDCGLLEARRQRHALAKLASQPTSPAPKNAPAPIRGKDGSVAVAEDRRGGAPSPGVTPDLSESDPVNLRSGALDLAEPLEWLTDEISMCLRYHKALFPDRPVNRAIFVGGEARHVGMCQHIARILRAPAQIADPLSHLARTGKEKTVNLDLSIPQPGWAAPLGLCHCPADL